MWHLKVPTWSLQFPPSEIHCWWRLRPGRAKTDIITNTELDHQYPGQSFTTKLSARMFPWHATTSTAWTSTLTSINVNIASFSGLFWCRMLWLFTTHNNINYISKSLHEGFNMRKVSIYFWAWPDMIWHISERFSLPYFSEGLENENCYNSYQPIRCYIPFLS